MVAQDNIPDPQREELANLLASDLETESWPIPQNQDEFEKIAGQLRELGPGDLREKAVITGLQNRPNEIDGEACRCQECMYFLKNKRWCDLPDLNLPVEHDWWCRLWRI